MPTDIVEQFSLCSKQKQMQDYFKSSPRAPTPIKDVSFKTVADAKDVSLVDSLDMDDMELESIDTTIASVAASALMKETPTRFSTPKHSRPPTSESSTPPTSIPQPSTSTATPSQPPAKKMKLNLGLSHPRSKILLSTSQVIHKIMNNSSSGSLSACSSIDSDSESASSQE